MLRLLLFLFCSGMLLQLPTSAAPAPDSARTKRLSILPVPTIGYAPETRWYAGAVALFALDLYSDTLTRTSNVELELQYTQNKQFISSLEWTLFSKEEKLYLIGNASFNKFPELFFGIGHNTEEKDQELFDSRRIEAKGDFLYQFRKGLFAGPRYVMQYMYNIKPPADSKLFTPTLPGRNGGLSSGFGYTLAYDKRDNILNPQKAGYIAFSNTFFGKLSGSDHTFTRYEIDARKYFSFFSNHVLAVQGLGIFSSNNPPFRMMPLLGSESDMRGYYRGRFRDKQYLAFQGEYRLPVYRIVGVAAFAGFGDVADKLSHFSARDFKPTVGGGLRIKVNKKENINMRFDYAKGRGSHGFYISFGEAF